MTNNPNGTMRAVQVVARGKAEFIEMPKPELKPGHALVRTKRLSLCGSDIRWLHFFPPERYPLPPGTTGHEMVGVVEAVDSPDGAIKPGDVALTLAPDHRAMVEYYVAPVSDVFVLPPDRPVEHGLQAQQLGTVIYACKQLPNLIGKDVAVIGQGSAGLYYDFMLRRMGARRVIGLDLQPHRLKAAEIFGATHTIHNVGIDPAQAIRDITGGELADVVIEAAGEIETMNLALDLVKHSGFVLQFGVPRGENFPFHYEKVFGKCLRIQGIVGAHHEPNYTSTRQALDMIASGEIDVSPLLTHSFPFERVMEAYELQHTRDEGAIKIVIEMPE
ncbi:MAG TPA: zinc-binding dehydrogenase [Spirillospora sp.]|nr:zinc-binding dehydrogenase [Spirillospora sp.]